jgi:hypothetical protein
VTSSPTSSIILVPAATKFDNLPPAYIEKIWRTFTSTATTVLCTKTTLKAYLDSLRTHLSPGREPSEAAAKEEFELHTDNLFAYWCGLQNDEFKKNYPPPPVKRLEDVPDADVASSTVYRGEEIYTLYTVVSFDRAGGTAEIRPPPSASDTSPVAFSVPLGELFVSELLLDFMEVFLGFLLTASMKQGDKLDYLFSATDFDMDDDLCQAEISLTMKSAEAGLARLRGHAPAPERRVVDLAADWHKELVALGGSVGNGKVSRQSYVRRFLPPPRPPPSPPPPPRYLTFATDPNGPMLPVLRLYAEAEGSVDVDEDVEKENCASNQQQGEEFGEKRTGGDEFMAVKPYVQAIPAPLAQAKPAQSSHQRRPSFLLAAAHLQTPTFMLASLSRFAATLAPSCGRRPHPRRSRRLPPPLPSRCTTCTGTAGTTPATTCTT